VRIQRVISQSHPIKTMFMGVITQPNEEQNSNGLVSLRRLSRQEILQRETYRYRFHLDHHVNQLIVDGQWRNLHDDKTYTMDELTHLVANFYELQDDVKGSLCYRYVTHVGAQRRRSFVRIFGHETIENKFYIDEEGTQRQLTINEVELSSHLPAGTMVEHEVTCNSAFMLHHVPLIAAEMREKMPWVPPTEPIYLVMDNAGGHGTQEAIEEYTRRALVEFNVVIIRQSARSPEVNEASG
jgi:hypothetical protein